MKLTHLIPVLACAAALGALRPAITPAFGVGTEPTAAARPAVTPPWLTGQWQEETAPEELEQDPHASVCSGLPVTAEDGSDPHAALCASSGAVGDPHAGLSGSDPHAALHPSADPHAELHAGPHGEGDPHAGRYTDPQADEVLYEAASIEPPSVPVEASKAPNGKRVAEVFAERTSLDQKPVAVRGVVVKLMEGILGQTYLHLQDGSGSADAGNNDLTVTTTEPFSLGETVEVQGLLAVDRDIGAGYSYPALLTGAVRVER
jgi:hypothetical protein